MEGSCTGKWTELKWYAASIFTPLFILHQLDKWKRLEWERENAWKLVEWFYAEIGCIDLWRYALGILKKISIEDPKRENVEKEKNYIRFRQYIDEFFGGEQKIYALLQDTYDPQVGGFKQHRKTIPTLYATFAAISVLKYLWGIDFYEKERSFGALKGTSFRDVFLEIIPRIVRESQVEEKVIEFTKTGQDEKLGGFYDSPYLKQYLPSLTATHSAFFILWNFNEEYTVKEKVFTFLVKHCLKKENNTMGFSLTPNTEPSAHCTRYALSILEQIDLEWIKRNKNYILNFFRACWVPEEGTFKPTLGSSHGNFSTTCRVVTCLAILEEKGIIEGIEEVVGKDGIKRIVDYFRSCNSKGGGFGSSNKSMIRGTIPSPYLYSSRDGIYPLCSLYRLGYISKAEFDVLWDKESCKKFLKNCLDENQNPYPSMSCPNWFKKWQWMEKFFIRPVVRFFLMPKEPRKMKITPIYHWSLFIIFVFFALFLDLIKSTEFYSLQGAFWIAAGLSFTDVLYWMLKYKV